MPPRCPSARLAIAAVAPAPPPSAPCLAVIAGRPSAAPEHPLRCRARPPPPSTLYTSPSPPLPLPRPRARPTSPSSPAARPPPQSTPCALEPVRCPRARPAVALTLADPEAVLVAVAPDAGRPRLLPDPSGGAGNSALNNAEEPPDPPPREEKAARKKKSAEKAAALEWARKMLEDASVNDGECWEPRAMTEEDVAAAAVYRAKAEEARRSHERREQHDAVTRWIATGDPEAVQRCNQWMEQDIEAMRLKDIAPPRICRTGRPSKPRGIENSGSFYGPTPSAPGRTPHLSCPCVTRTRSLRAVRPTPCELCRSFRSALQPSKVDWTGLWMCMVSSPHATRWITIATLSSTALGITAKPLTRRIHV
ncbi:vegetative cell wall protein gp1 [Triticum aestivum]|uniref:vegetative cell wall protein gp1 n=1 Tax=Triticum aestivum TaxID=4565 RepID=UPI001D02AF75|nr:vegetative cell wall protein gp1-like [Triticum aestivum]